MALIKINIGNEMSRGWTLFQKNMGILILAGLLVTLLSAFSLGILSGPLMVGLFLMLRRMLQKDSTVQIGDVFKGFEFFAQSFVLVVIWLVAVFLLSFLPVIGQLAGLAISALMMWSLMFIAYQHLGAMDAIKKVFNYLQQGDFTMPLLLAVLASIISGLGAIACGIGVIFTMPIGYCMLATCYETLFDTVEVIDVDVTVVETPPEVNAADSEATESTNEPQ